MESFRSDPPFSGFRQQLNERLLDTRTLVLNEALRSRVAGSIAEQLALLEAESADPIQFVMTTAPGGDFEAALSMYDLLRSFDAPVTMVGSGRISGAAVIGFLGAPRDRRFALPHVRFRLENPQRTAESGRGGNLEPESETLDDLREKVCSVIADTTGQSEAQVASDLSARSGFDPEEAVECGLVHRTVDSREEIGEV